MTIGTGSTDAIIAAKDYWNTLTTDIQCQNLYASATRGAWVKVWKRGSFGRIELFYIADGTHEIYVKGVNDNDFHLLQ